MKGHGRNVSGRLAGAAIRCQPDSRLVGLAREGHGRAFDEIVRRYRAPLVAFAAGFVPYHRAEDVVQEALAKAHGAITHGDAEINLRPWLFTIVRNGALNAIRDEPVHEHLEESFDGVPQPPEVAARREELRSLTDRLKGLPDPQRKALVKRELEGRSHEHIASSMGVTTGAVRGLIFRARTALRDGAGMLIPTPVLRALLSEGSVAPEAAGAAGAAAAAGLAAGGGGGIAVKAGATLGVAVLAVGSGLAIQHRGEKSDDRAEASAGHARIDARQFGGSGSGARLSGTGPLARSVTSNEGPGSSSSGPGGHQGSFDSSGPGPGSGGGSSGEGSAGDDQADGDNSGSGSSGADSSGSGSSGSGSDSSGSGSSGSESDDSGSGSSDSGTSGSGGSDSSGSGSSGSGSTDSSGSGSSGSGSTDSSGSGSSGTDEEDDEA